MDGENVRENSAWVDLIGVDGAAGAKEPENAPQNRQEEWYQYLGNAAELPEGGARRGGKAGHGARDWKELRVMRNAQ